MIFRMISVLILVAWSMQLAIAQHDQSATPAPVTQPTAPVQVQTAFRVRYVTGGTVYLEGGRSTGLAEGTQLQVRAADASATKASASNLPDETANADGSPAAPFGLPVVAELKVVAVAETSAVCEVISSTRPLVAGDVAMLPQSEVEKLVEKHTLGNTRSYPAVVSFSEGDPMDEDVRDEVPRPPLPEVNRARGRIGLDFSSINSSASGSQFGASSYTTGVVIRADMTRIYGTHWNLSGFWRGNIVSRSSTAQPTLQDLINRTYTLSLTYQNPDSRWLAGFGRMYLPWATSLQTIDGGYGARRMSEKVIVGIFAGSTPDPLSWSYNSNRRIGGGFMNVSGGSYDNLRYSSTAGAGVAMLQWQVDRPFFFTENSIDYKRVFSIYEALLLDQPHDRPGVVHVGTGVSQSYTTFRVQPTSYLQFDLNHSYFRDIPTYNSQLVGTGLLDKFLFQGFSGGVRVDVPLHITLYTTIGRSEVTGDASASWNTMYGITFNHIWNTGLRLDARYSNFNSPFATGDYRTVDLSRNFGERFRGEVQAGMQKYVSSMSRDDGSRFLNAFFDFSFGRSYFFEGGFTLDRGTYQNYNQIYTIFGYRFDNRWNRGNAGVMRGGSAAMPVGAGAIPGGAPATQASAATIQGGADAPQK
jgi:hypothetical protein